MNEDICDIDGYKRQLGLFRFRLSSIITSVTCMKAKKKLCPFGITELHSGIIWLLDETGSFYFPSAMRRTRLFSFDTSKLFAY